jgi:hypothetical protein
LRSLPLRLQVGDDRLDLVDRPRRQPELDARDHLAGTKIGVAVAEPELLRRAPVARVGSHDQRALDDRCPVGAVGACIHLDAAAGGSGNRAGELEPAQTGCARAMQRDRIRGAAAGDEQLALDLHLRELAVEPQDQAVEAFVGHEQIGAETDGGNGKTALGREAERLLQLVDGGRTREGARRAAGAERGVARERDALLDLHASLSSSAAAARSTSPAPIVTTRSPGRTSVRR